MAMYGIGANYGWVDVSDTFIDENIVACGWDFATAPDIHEMFRNLDVGDIVYIKSCYYNTDITVKAIGIIWDNIVLTDAIGHELIEIGRNVKWIDTNEFLLPRPQNQKNNVRANTIYREFHPDIISRIMLIVNKII